MLPRETCMSGTGKVNSIGAVRSTTRNELPRHTRAEGPRDADRVFDRTGVRQTGSYARLCRVGAGLVSAPPGETQQTDRYHARPVRPRSATHVCTAA